MVKAYLRYEQHASLGVITSNESNSIVLPSSSAWIVATAALEDICIWHMRQNVLLGRFHELDEKHAVTCLAMHPNGLDLAAGYADGTVRLWRLPEAIQTLLASGRTTATWPLVEQSPRIVFRGHRGAINVMSFSQDGVYLASGSRDTEIIVWHLLDESGLARFRGHSDAVQGLAFLDAQQLVSGSKDGHLKIWDLATRHCVETCVEHGTSSIWSLTVAGDRLVTGAQDQQLRIYRIDGNAVGRQLQTGDKVLHWMGSIQRQSRERAVQLISKDQILTCQNNDRTIEVYRWRNEEEIKKKLARRRRRQREKEGEQKEETNEMEITADDELNLLHVVHASSKVRSFDFLSSKQSDQLQILCALSNNALEVYSVPTEKKRKENAVQEPLCLQTFESFGHRQIVRAVALSSNDEILVTASSDALKLWNIRSGQCTRTMPLTDVTEAMDVSFVPGDRHVLVACKDGSLLLFDVISAQLLERIEAHDACCWSMDIRPDRRGLMTGGADKQVHFFDFELIEDAAYSLTQRRLTLALMRTWKMSDDVLCVRHSPNQQYVAVALLDCTVKIFYHDTLKFFLSLYGHKLPILSMDMSSDNALLVTASADKTIKVWGLDFGDCHCSLLSHTDAITQVRFVYDTHYFFSTSKDKQLKYWDADTRENIQTLSQHHAPLTALAVSHNSGFVVTASHDRSIRLWRRTKEQLFLEEEREKDLEEQFDAQLDLNDAVPGTAARAAENDATAIVTKVTQASLKASERLMEALDLAEHELTQFQASQTPVPLHPMMAAYHVEDLVAGHDPQLVHRYQIDAYVLRVVQSISLASLEDALLVLPFNQICALLRHAAVWAEKRWQLPLTLRLVYFLLRVHRSQLIASRLLRVTLLQLREHLSAALKQQHAIFTQNHAALRHVQRQIQEDDQAQEWEEKWAAHEQSMNKALKRKVIAE